MHTIVDRRSFLKSVALVGALSLLLLPSGRSQSAETLPAEISDQAFWTMVEDMSESGGFFPMENLASNERGYELLIPKLQSKLKPGGVYIGVGPEQNFHYIAALRPRIAFIIDIRRQNMIQHLLYKAAFELSADRAEFLSRLFSRKRPSGLTKDSTVEQLFAAYDVAERDAVFAEENRRALRDFLNRYKVTEADLDTFDHVFDVFAAHGTKVSYSSKLDTGGPAPTSAISPSYRDLMTAADGDRMNRSYLASQASFSFIKGMEKKNLIIPLVGNFGGPKTIRAVGRYVKDHGAVVTAFYVSNVEQYLFRPPDRTPPVDRNFYESVATLPVDDLSTFIRSGTLPGGGLPGNSGFRPVMSPIDTILEAYTQGRIRSHTALFDLSTN
jgi:hypothetical protein